MNRHVPILLYHSISTKSSAMFKRWVVPPSSFENQLCAIYKNGFTPITVSEFIALRNNPNLSKPKKPVLLTFDDGFADFYTNAVPLLERVNFPSTLYVPTKFIDKTSQWLWQEGEGERPLLTTTQLKALPQFGVEIGAHTHTHPQLDLIPIDQAIEEIYTCKTRLESILQQSIHSFAYPHGHHNKQVRQAVIESGFTSACGVKDAMSHWQDDPFSLARIIVPNDMSIEQFNDALNGKGLSLAPKQERFKTKLGRLKRRFELSRGVI